MRLLALGLVGGLLVAGSAGAAELSEAERRELAQHFGFESLQTYRLEYGISNLVAGDLDGDGRTDLALFNGYRNRIELLFQPNPDIPRASDEPDRDQNELPSRGPLIVQHIPVPYRVADLQIGDVTGDGKNDLVFFGEPKELVVLAATAPGAFAAPAGIRAPQGEAQARKLVLADLNGDDRTDAALLGSDALLLFFQQADGRLGDPVVRTHSVPQPLTLETLDVNADGRADLLITSDGEQAGAYVFLQGAAGGLGPLHRVEIPALRATQAVPRFPGGDDLLAIEETTGRLIRYRWQVPTSQATQPTWPLLLYSYPVNSKSDDHPAAVGPITGDARVDLVVADPEAARLYLYTQSGDALAAGQGFPGLKDTLDVQIVNADDDPAAELLSVSATENLVGVSDYANGRLTFPAAVATKGAVLGAAVADQRLAYLTRIRDTAEREALIADEDDREAEAFLIVTRLAGDDEFTYVAVEELDDEPRAVRWADVNQDGRRDILAFFDFSPLLTFLQTEDGEFEAFGGANTRSGLVERVRLPATTFVDITADGKPEMIVADSNIARALAIVDGRWSVIDQINPPRADARLTGLTGYLHGGEPHLVAYDQRDGEVALFTRDANDTFARGRTLPLGAFDVSFVGPLPSEEGEPPHLVVLDADRLALLQAAQRQETLYERQTYASNEDEAWLSAIAAGDVNGDDTPDVVLVDARKAHLELLSILPDNTFVQVHRFQVYEGKRFRDEPEYGGEPREILVADINADGVDDIVMIVHDRVIVYPASQS